MKLLMICLLLVCCVAVSAEYLESSSRCKRSSICNRKYGKNWWLVKRTTKPWIPYVRRTYPRSRKQQ
uniref:Secreted protein n=1 Tax=Steinernema glaseri TaxID=37863 RepID=A0A1I8AQM6_9BILA